MLLFPCKESDMYKLKHSPLEKTEPTF